MGAVLSYWKKITIESSTKFVFFKKKSDWFEYLKNIEFDFFKFSGKSDLHYFVNNRKTVDNFLYKYIYSESVLNYLHAFYKIEISEQ